MWSFFLRWMYPVERYMKVLKGYTKNQYWLEASIVEKYVVEEAIDFFYNTLKQFNLWGFLKLVMIGHEEVRVHEDTML